MIPAAAAGLLGLERVADGGVPRGAAELSVSFPFMAAEWKWRADVGWLT